MKVFRLNEFEWYAAATLEGAVRCAMATSGLPREEVLDESYEPFELTGEQLQDSTYQDLEGVQTFAERLKQLLARDENFPCFFADADY
jgi:hypothetical protein